MEEEIWKPSSDIPDGKCTICRIDIQGHGNNPSPVKEEGKCCDTCNSLVVLPHRLRASGMTEDEVKSYLETMLSKERRNARKHDPEDTGDGPTVIQTKTGTTIVSGGNITINGKRVKPKDYRDPLRFGGWRRESHDDYRRYDQGSK